ncbi:hypothetical protein HAX54_024001, partial [Datura stramonium]|nr:hypothetical protein [Datura stramonium]
SGTSKNHRPKWFRGVLDIESSDESPIMTIMEQPKPKEAVEEGDNNSKEFEEDGNATEESCDKENTTAESDDKESGFRDIYYTGLQLNEKENPSRSIQEEPQIQTNALNEDQSTNFSLRPTICTGWLKLQANISWG